jgi:hypothetical protein
VEGKIVFADELRRVKRKFEVHNVRGGKPSIATEGAAYADNLLHLDSIVLSE